MAEPKTKNRRTKKDAARQEAAEEVCWALMLMIQLGGLELSYQWKRFLTTDIEKWVALAVETGHMNEGGEPVRDSFADLNSRIEKLERGHQ